MRITSYDWSKDSDWIAVVLTQNQIAAVFNTNNEATQCTPIDIDLCAEPWQSDGFTSFLTVIKGFSIKYMYGLMNGVWDFCLLAFPTHIYGGKKCTGKMNADEGMKSVAMHFTINRGKPEEPFEININTSMMILWFKSAEYRYLVHRSHSMDLLLGHLKMPCARIEHTAGRTYTRTVEPVF